jgi:integrase
LTEESKNLATVEPTKAAQREGTIAAPDQATTKGLIVQFSAWLERENYTAPKDHISNLLILMRRGANLLDPESVKVIIARLRKRNGQPWKDGAKMLMVHTYNLFTQALKIEWKPPQYKQEDIEPFIPDETELDQLIAACQSKRMAAFLQCLKETFADPGEILPLEWTDLNGDIITINHPVKGHRPGQAQVSSKLLMMLNNLPHKSERIFPTTYECMYTAFGLIRRRTAKNLQNPRLRKISFVSFRHWGGTMLAERTHERILTVQKLLRHKSITSTMKYIGKIHWKNDDYDVATATTVEEVKKLAESGFEKFDEFNGIHVFRKLKIFKPNM